MPDQPLRAYLSRQWVAAAFVGGVSIVLGVVTLGSKSLWFDEAFDAELVKRPWSSTFSGIVHAEMSQALYLVLLKAWAEVTPTSEVWIRLPSVVFAALAAALLVPVGARLFDLPTGALAGVLLATNEMIVSWSQQSRTYTLTTLAVVGSTLLFLHALDAPTRGRWLVYGVGLCRLPCTATFYAGFVVVAQFAAIPFAPRRPPRRRVIEAGGLVVVASIGAVTFSATASRSQYGWFGRPSIQVMHHVLDATIGHNDLFAVAVVFGLVLLTYRATAIGGRATFQLALVGGLIVLPIVLARLASLNHPIIQERYMIVICPGLALAAAAFGIAVLRAPRPIAAAGIVGLVAIVVVSATQIGDWYRSTPEDWRGAVAYVHRVEKPGDSVYVAPMLAIDAFRYYDDARLAYDADRPHLCDRAPEQVLRPGRGTQPGDGAWLRAQPGPPAPLRNASLRRPARAPLLTRRPDRLGGRRRRRLSAGPRTSPPTFTRSAVPSRCSTSSRTWATSTRSGS